MGKLKKVLITLLSIMLLLSTIGLMACGGGVEIKTKTPGVKYYVGYNVDMFDFFVQEGGVRYSFTVTDMEGNEESTSRQYFVDTAGDYTATCKATKGNKTVSKSVTFTVYDSVPFMLLAKNNLVVDWNSKDSLNNIFSYSQARVITESACDQIIDYVLVYDQADGSGRKVDLSLDNPSGDGMWDGRRAFKFTFEGDYDFHLVARSNGGEATAMLRVTALENYYKYEDIEMNLKVDEIGRTANWSAVSGAVSYRVKIGIKSTEVKTTSININDYITKDFENFDFAVIAIDAKGAVIGKQVAKKVVIAPEGFEGIALSSGAKVDLENSQVNIMPAKSTIHSVAGVSKEDVHYLAYCGDYGVGYFVDFYFTGNNLPQVCLFSNDLDTNLTNSEGGKGILIMNGMYSGHTPNLLFNSLRAFGPNRMSDAYNHGNLFVLKDGYEQFSKEYLQKDENANNRYKYVVGTEETAHGTINLVLQLWSVDNKGNEDLLYLVNKDTKIKTEDLPAGNIVAYGAMAGPSVDTTFTFCKKPYSYNMDGIKSSGAIFTTNGEVWLAAGQLGSSAQPFTIIPTALHSNGTALGLSNSFIGLDGNYDVGTYIDIFFKGNNMPEVMLFADEINGNMSGYSAYTHADPFIAEDSGEKGVLISNGMKGHEDNDINEYFTIWGPNRVHFGENVAQHGAFVTYVKYAVASIKDNDPNFALLTQSVLSKEEYADTNFKYTVGTYDVSGKLGIHIKLYEVNGETETLLLEYIKATTISLSELEAGGIVMYGTMKSSTELTKFSYSEPYESKPPYIASGVSIDKDGVITTAGANAGNRMYDLANVNNAYYALDGEYGVGTYVDTYFTGNNMPEIMFFSDVISGNMTGFATYTYVSGSGDWSNYTLNNNKGLLFSNGFSGGANNNGAPDKYTIWGMDRVYSDKSLAAGLRDATSGALKIYADGTDVAKVLSQLSLEKYYAETQFKYTVGTYADGEYMAVEVIMENVQTGEELVHINYTTGILVADVTPGSIIFYDTIKNAPTVFKASEPYTFGGEGHVHSFDNQNSNGFYHWNECECGRVEEKIAHTGGTATCSEKAKCEVCNTPYGDFAHDFKTLEFDADYHWYKCECGVTNEKVAHFGGTPTTTQQAKCEICDQAYGELIAEGTIVTNKATVNADESYTLTGGASAHAGASAIFAADLGYVAIQGNYPAGYFVDFEFTGNNLPQVMFFADHINGKVSSYDPAISAVNGEKGLLITNGVFSTSINNSFASLHHTVTGGYIVGGKYLTAYGPNKIDGNMLTMLGAPATRVMATDTLLTYKGLEADTSGRTYIYKVGTILDSDNTIIACAELYDKATGVLVATSNVDTGILNTALPAANIIAYAGIKGANVNTTFKLVKKPYLGEFRNFTREAEILADGSISLTAKTLKASGQLFGLIKGSADFNTQGEISYFGIKGEYGVGTYVDVTFTGNNMPEVMLFASHMNGMITGYTDYSGGKAATSGEKGVLISNGIGCTSHPGRGTDGYFTVWGPNKLFFGDGATVTGVFSDHRTKANVLIPSTDTSYSLLTQSILADAQYANTNFKCTIGTYEEGENLGLHIILYDVTSGTEVKLLELKQDAKVKLTDVSAGNIIFYDSMKGSNTVFKVGEIRVPENA